MRTFFDWLDHRTGYRHLMREALYEPIPGGARWRYVWGSTLTFTFAVQVITGLFLWTAYSPSAQTAWESVFYITKVMEYGWVVRGIHHYAAQAMVVLLALHFMQIVVDSAYRAPREVNFWLGIILMQIVLGLALTGYLLPWDQNGYYSTKVATNIMGLTPGVGREMQTIVQGGTQLGHHTLTRFFALHAGILPTLLVMFLALHIYVFRRHAIMPARPEKSVGFAGRLTFAFGPAGAFYSNVIIAIVMTVLYAGAGWLLLQAWGRYDWSATTFWTICAITYFAANLLFCPWSRRSARQFEAKDAYFWPDQILKDAVACLAVLAVVLFLTVGRPVELGAPADPSQPYRAARPEWYFLFLFQFLKFHWVEEMGPAFGPIVVPGIIMTIIVLMPLVGRWKLGHRFNVAFVGALMIGVAYLTSLAIYSDRHNDEYKQDVAEAHRDGQRAIELALAFGTPAEGAQGLLRQDPLTQGPKLFATNCSACHRFNNQNGLGRDPSDEATAPDLGNFGTREWTTAVLVNYQEHFAPLKNATWEGENKGKDFLEGDMASWSTDNGPILLEHPDALKALVEFVVSESGRPNLDVNAELAARGKEIFSTGAIAEGVTISACTDCHSMHARGDAQPLLEVENASAPTLTGYAGTEWIREFIKDPGAAKFYGVTEHNAMPAFKDRLSEPQIDLLSRWLAGDYYQGAATPDEHANVPATAAE